jgi:hypothetical protein
MYTWIPNSCFLVSWSINGLSAVVQVFCYALNQSDGSEWRQRISAEAEHFVDVSTMTSDAIAHLMSDDRIQILVNLNGYTKVTCSSLVPLLAYFMQLNSFPGVLDRSFFFLSLEPFRWVPELVSHIVILSGIEPFVTHSIWFIYRELEVKSLQCNQLPYRCHTWVFLVPQVQST